MYASLIYAYRPVTSDKSLTLRHYLFGCVCTRKRGFQTSRENDTFAMNIKRTPTLERHTDTGTSGDLTPRILYEASSAHTDTFAIVIIRARKRRKDSLTPVHGVLQRSPLDTLQNHRILNVKSLVYSYSCNSGDVYKSA